MRDMKKTKAELVTEVRALRDRLERVEMELSHSEERLRSLIDLAPLMVWEIDAAGVITLSQGKALEILGFAPRELVGVDARTLFADDPLMIDDIQEMLSGKEMTTTRVIAGRLIESRHIPILDERGEVSRVIGVGIDVTEQREGEVNLRELSERFALSQEIAQLGSWEWDLRKGTQVWSERIYEIFGVAPETFTPGYEAFLDFVHEEDRHLIRASLNRAVTDPDTSFDARYRIVLRDGTIRHVHTRGEVMRVQGERPRRLIGTVQDVTDQVIADAALRKSERRRADLTGRVRDCEARLRSLQHALHAGVLIARGGEISFACDRAAEILGQGSAGLLGARLETLLPAGTDGGALREIDAQMKRRGAGTTEATLRRPDGESRSVLLGGSPVDPDDPGAGVTYAVIDLAAL